MAAATITGSEAASTAQARAGVGETILYGEFSLVDDNASGALELNDVMEVVKVPKGFQVFEVIFSTTDLDTNGTPTIELDVGDGSDTDRFISGSGLTIAEATGGYARLNNLAGFGYIYTAADTIDVKVLTGPATGATTGTVKVAVIGRMV
jgi:hypothetical protein